MTAILWFLVVVMVGSYLLDYCIPVERAGEVDKGVDDLYLDALQAAQRIHSLAWSARQAMYEEARHSIGGE